MTLISDEILSAYIDGELDADGAAMVDSELAKNPALARRLDAMRAIEARLGPAFDGVMAERTPDRFEAMLSPPARRRPEAAGGYRSMLATLLRPMVIGPAFASLTIGIISGALLQAPRMSGFDLAQTGRIIPVGRLAEAIGEAPSGVAVRLTNGELLVRLSFLDTAGRYCRHVSLAAQDMVVCGTGEGWAIEAMAPNGRSDGSTEAYQEAAGNPPAGIAAAIERLGVTSALDAESERALISRNWTQN